MEKIITYRLEPDPLICTSLGRLSNPGLSFFPTFHLLPLVDIFSFFTTKISEDFWLFSHRKKVDGRLSSPKRWLPSPSDPPLSVMRHRIRTAQGLRCCNSVTEISIQRSGAQRCSIPFHSKASKSFPSTGVFGFSRWWAYVVEGERVPSLINHLQAVRCIPASSHTCIFPQSTVLCLA